eukprot:403337716
MESNQTQQTQNKSANASAFDFAQLASILGTKLDAKTKFKLLDMIDQREVVTVHDLNPSENILNDDKIQQLIEDKIDYLIVDDLKSLVTQENSLNLSDNEMMHEFLLKCREEGVQLAQSGKLQESGFGKGESYEKDKKVRGDQFIWLSYLAKKIKSQEFIDDNQQNTRNDDNTQEVEGLQSLGHLRSLVQIMTKLTDKFNPILNAYEKLDDFEVQLAQYSGSGEYYLRHKDAFRLDTNNLQDGQRLRKITAIIYLNPELKSQNISTRKDFKLGELRLYLKDKIVDITPHIGRCILFKSEKIEHEVKPTQGYQRFALTTWFRHTHRVEQKKTEIDSQDAQLIPTVKNMIENSQNPSNLHFGIFHQLKLDDSLDQQIQIDLTQLIEAYQSKGVKITVKTVNYTEAKNAYYARVIVQQMYQNENYYLQIDSHMRFVKNWDQLLIKYLSQCQNPQKSILTVYPRPYKIDDQNIENFESYNKIESELQGPVAMCFKEFNSLDLLPRLSSKVIKKSDMFQKPFQSLFWAAGFSFSYGQLIQDCGYSVNSFSLNSQDQNFIDDLFFGEEIYQMYKFFKKDYALYSPPKTVAYHLWERKYRPTYKEDHQEDMERTQRQKDCQKLVKLIIDEDQEFIEEMIRRGVDFKNQSFNEVAQYGGIDQSFF